MSSRQSRRALLSGAAAALAAGALPRRALAGATAVKGVPTLVGSRNALAGMKLHYDALAAGGHPLDVAIDVVKVTEADPTDHSVGLGGLPNEDGVCQMDAACMDGETHNSGAVAALENCLHPSEIARLVMERTDHCLIVGAGAERFARMHGHPRVELLTEEARKRWLRWKETHSTQDDRLPPRKKAKDEKQGALRGAEGAKTAAAGVEERITGTIHCSALALDGHVACTTTTSGLAWKIPGRVGDSPIVGAGLYCDQEAGSAGATGRGEAAVLSNGSASIVNLLRAGASPEEAGLEVLGRVARQAKRASSWQPGLVDDAGRPSFGLKFYILGLDGRVAGVSLRDKGDFAVADPNGGPRLEQLTVWS